MPIPFIIAGVAAVAAGYGLKKSYDAYEDNNMANDYNKKATETYENAQDALNSMRETTNINLEKLGELKLNIYKNNLGNFVELFSKIKNIDFDSQIEKDLKLGDLEPEDLLVIKNQVLKIEELAGGTVTALGSGALAGFGAFGGAGMLATASTGTAISSLSGVAATNATLAWFGGGSLAAGGLGMAGGTMILGGIVAGPIIAVAGGLLAAKAEKAKYDAIANFDKANALAEEMKTARIVVKGICIRVEEFINVLTPLNDLFSKMLDKLEEITSKHIDYKSYKKDEQEIVFISLSIAKTVKNLCDTPIIDESGKITISSKKVLENTREFISNLEKKYNG